MAALLGVALLGVLPGILLAIALSILNVFRRVWWPHQAELGRVEGLAGLHDTESYPDAELLPGLVVFRFDAPLIFANSRTFGDAVRAMVHERAGPALGARRRRADHRRRHHGRGHARRSSTAGSNDRGVSLVFAEMKDPVRDKIERYELTRTIDPSHFFATLDEAVAAYIARDRCDLARPPPRSRHRGAHVTARPGQGTAPTRQQRRPPGWPTSPLRRSGRIPGGRSSSPLGRAARELASLAVLVVAAWFALSPPRDDPLVAAGVGVVALVIFIVVVVASESLWVLVVGLALAAACRRGGAGCPAAARRRTPRTSPAAPRPRATGADHEPRGPGAGRPSGSSSTAAAASAASSRSSSRRGRPAAQLAEDAVARGADVIGMAGGDGSQALVASVASRHGHPVRRRPGRDPQPLRPRPRAGPRGRGRRARRLRRRRRPAASTWPR